MADQGEIGLSPWAQNSTLRALRPHPSCLFIWLFPCALCNKVTMKAEHRRIDGLNCGAREDS